MNKIDIFICSYLRAGYTLNTINYIKERTTYPYRLFLIDQGGNSSIANSVDRYIQLKDNFGIHAAWNVALALAESDYFITTDNDIYVPDLRDYVMGSNNTSETLLVNRYAASLPAMLYEGTKEDDWLSWMVRFMDERPDYGAISLHPHVFIGAAGIDPTDPEDVKERNMCGAVMRLMRREAVWKAGGWENKIEAGRNHEERTICSRLQTAGYKVGITSRLRAYHPFGKDLGTGNWGYPPEVTPEMQGHNPDLKDYVQAFDNPDAYDSRTWLPK